MLKYNNFRFLLFVLLTTVFSCGFFTLSNYIHVPLIGFLDWAVNIVHFLIVMSGCYVLYYLLAINKFVFAFCFPLIVTLSAGIAYFVMFQNVNFTTSILDSALHNDIRTSLDVITLPLILFISISITISIVAVVYRFRIIKYKFKWIEFVAVCLVGIFVYGVNQYRNNSIFQRLPFSIYYVSEMYSRQLQSINKPRVEIGTDANCNSDTITLVLVIGESARADHFQINGYKRATNPLLSKLPIISYPNIYSEWTHTNPSLSHFLTRSDSVNHEPAVSEHSFISVFNRCDFATNWIANQEPAPSYLPFVKESQKVIYVNPSFSVYNYNKKWLDEDNLPYFEQALNNKAARKLIIIHTIGSHWWYNDHFTNSTLAFKPILRTKNIATASQDEIINSYDNSIVYTDYFLSEIINYLKEINACVIYLSDHGESLGENGKWLHAQDNEPEKHPACIFWFSQKYISKNQNKFSNINANRNKKWRTDFLFHSILSIAGVNSSIIQQDEDITEY